MNVEQELQRAIVAHPEGGILRLAHEIHRRYGAAAKLPIKTLIVSVVERSRESEACRIAAELLREDFPADFRAEYPEAIETDS